MKTSILRKFKHTDSRSADYLVVIPYVLHLTGLVLHVVALGWRRALCVDETVVPFHTCCRCHTAPGGGFVLSQPVNTSDGQCAVAHNCIFNRI